MIIQNKVPSSTDNLLVAAWNIFKDRVLAKTRKAFEEEGIKGYSNAHCEVYDYYVAFLYCYMLYKESALGLSTWEELTAKYELDKTRKCLACKGIDIREYLEFFDLPPLAVPYGIGQGLIGKSAQVGNSPLLTGKYKLSYYYTAVRTVGQWAAVGTLYRVLYEPAEPTVKSIEEVINAPGCETFITSNCT